MDGIDRKLLVLLVAEPRMHYREIAKRLGISRQAVHHRIQVMMKTGVVIGTTAGISFAYLDAVPVIVFGRFKTAPIEKVLDRFRENESTRRVVVAGGDVLYIVGMLRDISELDSFTEFVVRVAEMKEPTVGIFNLDSGPMPDYTVDGIGNRKSGYKKLAPLDLRIISSLRNDARRSPSDIAKVVGASTRTVRRRLRTMLSEGSLDIGVRVDAALGGDMMFVVQVNIRDGADKGGVARRLLTKYQFEDAFVRTFSNLPSLLLWVFWTDKLAEMRKILGVVDEDEDVLSITPNFVYLERVYATWRDKLLMTRARPSKKIRTRKRHS